jgi:hypothetical protein
MLKRRVVDTLKDVFKILPLTVLCGISVLCWTGIAAGEGRENLMIPEDLPSLCGYGDVTTGDDPLRHSSTLGSVLVTPLKAIQIDRYDQNRWNSKEEALSAIKDLLSRKSLPVSDQWQWNLSPPATMKGILEFEGGVRKPFGVAQHRVCFLDSSSKAWFFEWKEQVPWKE